MWAPKKGMKVISESFSLLCIAPFNWRYPQVDRVIHPVLGGRDDHHLHGFGAGHAPHVRYETRARAKPVDLRSELAVEGFRKEHRNHRCRPQVLLEDIAPADGDIVDKPRRTDHFSGPIDEVWVYFDAHCLGPALGGGP